MLRKLLVVTAVVLALVACKSKAAFNFSETIVAKERSLGPSISETEEKVNTFMTAGQFDSAAAVSQRMEAKVQEKITEIEAMPVPGAKGAAEFKTAALEYFRYIKSIYTAYINVSNADSQEQRDRIIATLNDLVTEKNSVITKMQEAQQKFAKANGFKIQ